MIGTEKIQLQAQHRDNVMRVLESRQNGGMHQLFPFNFHENIIFERPPGKQTQFGSCGIIVVRLERDSINVFHVTLA